MIKCESLYLLALNNLINPDFSLSKNAINYGAFVGIIISVVQQLLFIFDIADNSMLQLLILVFAISYGIRLYRDRANSGYISYEQALGFGVLVSIGSSLVFAFFYYIYIKYLNYDLFIQMSEQMQLELYKTELDDNVREDALKMMPKIVTPGLFAVTYLFLYFIFGGISSLLISIFVKNPKTEF